VFAGEYDDRLPALRAHVQRFSREAFRAHFEVILDRIFVPNEASVAA
jgi:hypothetical protein